MSAPDLIHPNTTLEYAPLDPATSVSEKALQELIDTPTTTKPGTVDFIATPPDEAATW